MADLYLEYDYLPKKKQRRRALRKRPRWPFVLLGFFIGFITLPALIAGAVFLFVSRPVEKTVNTIDKMTDAGLYETLFGNDDKVGILSDRYGEMALKDALGDIVKIAEKGGELSFQDLAEISPKVTESIDKLIASAEEKSIILDKTEVMTTPLNKFSDLLMDEVKEIELGEVLLATKSDIFDDESTGAILKNLFFGKFGVNYTVDEGKITMLPITYEYDGNTFTCIDETVYTKNGDVWKTENNDNYIAVHDEGFALYSSYGELIYQLQSNQEKSLAKYTAVTVNAEGFIEKVKQKSLALGDFMDKGSNPMDIIGKLELGTLLGITTKGQAEAEGNAMLVALAYGTYGEDYYYDGEQASSLIIEKEGGKPFTTLNDLMNSPDQVLNGMKLGSLLGITTHEDAIDDKNSMLVALAYGTYGTDYTFACNGVECTEKDCENPNCIVVEIETSDRNFTTLDDLMNKSDEVLNGIRLGTLLGITTKGDIESGKNDMMVAIAYGTFGVDFYYDDDGNIKSHEGKNPTTLGDLINNPDTVLNGIQLGSLLGITTHADAIDDKNSMLATLAYGTYGTDYTFACDGVECTKKDCENPNCIVVAIETSDRKFTTLDDLMNNSDEVLNSIPLGTLLGITNKADIESGKNDMMVAIAYGTYGEDYYYDDNGNIKSHEGKKPTTLGDLINSPDTVLNGIQLGSLLGITTHKDAVDDNNKMLVALAYGTYGTDYKFACDGVECTKKDCESSDCIVVAIETSDRQFTTLNDLMNNSDDVLNGIPLGTLLGITTKEAVESGDNDMMVAIAYGTYGVNFKYDGDAPDSLIIPFDENQKFTTLGNLINTPDDVLQTLQIGTLLGITTKEHIEGNAEKDIQAADSLLVSIAFGTYDVDFEYDANGKIVPKAGGKPFTTVKNLMDSGEAEEIFKNIPLSSIFAVDVFDPEADPLTVSLVYGTEGKHYALVDPVDGEPCTTCGKTTQHIHWLPNEETTDVPDDVYSERTFGELRDGDLTDIVNDLKVSDVFEINENSPKLLQSIKDWNISYLSDDTRIKALTIEQVMDIDASDNFLNAIKGWPIGEIGEEKIKGLKIGEVITIDDSSDSFLKAIKDWEIGKIGQDKVKELKLVDVLGEQTDAGLLKTLVTKTHENGDLWTIGDLDESNIKSLTLGEVLPSAIATNKDGTYKENDFFAALKDTPLEDLNADYIKKTLTIGQALGITAENEKDYGILLTFKDTYIKDFNEALLKSTLKIGDVVDTDHPVLNVLKDKHLDEINEDLIQSELEKLKLSQIIELEDGEELHPIFKTLQDKTLGEITKGNLIDGLTVGQAIGMESTDDPILGQIIDLKLGDLKDSSVLKGRINNLQLCQLIDNLPTTGVLGEMRTWTVGSINEDKVNSIKLSSLFTVESGDTGLLATLVNKTDSEGNPWTLKDLTSANINGLTLSEVLGEAEVNGNFYLKHLSTSTLGSLATDIQKITIVDLFADSVYEKATSTTPDDQKDSEGFLLDENGNRIITGTWKYLLRYNPDTPDTDPSDDPKPEDYKVTEMSQLIENMHNNIEDATLQALHDDGIIPHLGDDSPTLTQPLISTGLENYADAIASALGLKKDQDIHTMKIGDLTVLQASDYLTYLLQIIPYL